MIGKKVTLRCMKFHSLVAPSKYRGKIETWLKRHFGKKAMFLLFSPEKKRVKTIDLRCRS